MYLQIKSIFFFIIAGLAISRPSHSSCINDFLNQVVRGLYLKNHKTYQYMPQKYSLSSTDLYFDYKNDLEMLEAINVQTSPMHIQSSLLNKYTKGEVDLDAMENNEYFFGKVLEVTELGDNWIEANPFLPALIHPKMPAAFRKLQRYGYKLAIDTSLGNGNEEALHWRASKDLAILAIRPNTSWVTFSHEMEHAEFVHILGPHFFKLQAMVMKGMSLEDAFRHIKEIKRIAHMSRKWLSLVEHYMKKGLSPIAVSESLAVSREITVSGYSKFHPVHGVSPWLYGVATRVASFGEKIEKGELLTNQEAVTFLESYFKYHLGVYYQKSASLFVKED